MFLSEVLNQPTYYQPVKSEYGERFAFKIDDVVYVVNVSKTYHQDARECKEMLDLAPDETQHLKWFKDGDGVSITWLEFLASKGGSEKDIRHDITGYGNAFQVFATVREIFNAEIRPSLKKGSLVAMSAKTSEPNRVRLYRRFIKQFAGAKDFVELKGIHEHYFVAEF